MKKTRLFKSLMALAVMLVVSATAWAAGYTRTLSNDLKVTGYKAKTFYDFQNNTPAVLPTSGDLRYRAYEKGGYWGLHNYGGSSRTGIATIPVVSGEILVIQEYNADYVTTINRGTENATLSSSTGYRVFEITTTADDVTFTVPRYGGIVAALVMEKDADAETADYTINYVAGNDIVKTVTGNEAVGTVLTIEDAVWNNDVKYIKNEGQPSSYTVVSGTNEVNISVREAATCSYTVNATDGTNILKTLATGSVYEGESVLVAFPRYFNVNGTLYEKSSTDYRQNVVVSADAQVTDFVYTATNITGVVYFSEAEDIEGATATSAGNNMKTRSSNAACGYIPAEAGDITLANLPMGIYKATVVCYSNSSGGATQNFTFGDEVYNAQVSGANNWAQSTKEFTLSEAADIKWLNTSTTDSRNGLDFIYIQKTGVYFASMSIVGDFSENAWDATQGIAMTQSTENPAIWTAVVENFEITSDKLKYEYKAVANQNWDEYDLPDGDNQNYDFTTAGAGKYKLTFTADTENHEVSLVAEKQPTATVYYVNTWDWNKVCAWAYNDSGNQTQRGAWPGDEMTKTGEQVDGHDVYVWNNYKLDAPTMIMFNDGSDANKTGEYPFEDGATYVYSGLSAVAKTISAAGYATYCSPYALDFSEVSGLKAYIAIQDGDSIKFVQVSKVPANTGVLLKGEGEYNINVVASAEAVEGNLLVGVLADTKVAAGNFVLMNGDDGVGFYKTTKEFTVGANTAYLEGAAGGARMFIGFDENTTTTAINAVAAEQMNGEVYNLKGQRVAQPSKGLYIVNGKKVVLK